MKRFLLLSLFAAAFGSAQAQYNQLWIPDTLSGTVFNLQLNQHTKQYQTGAVTNTYGVNDDSFWGPTLIMRKGDSIQMHVTNNLPDTTTTHWHGFHIPPMMDGGPHQPIAPGTTWSPTFTMRNNAATFWYHPHLHMMTMQQMMMGLGGMIIVRDDAEAALDLPRTYGVDDIPLALTSRRFTNTNQFDQTANYGDYQFVNGTMNAETTLPAQWVRLRILDAEEERSYILGFSDNRTFYMIGTDGGLINAPLALTRVRIGVGERVELLVDLSGQEGQSFDLKAYNGGQAQGFPGGEPSTTGATGSLLNNTTFEVLHINVGAATASPVTAMPTTLMSNTYWADGQQDVSRTVNLVGGQPGPGGSPFTFDNTGFNMDVINKTIPLNSTEKWTLTNTSFFSHMFHIHDIEFNIVSRSSGAVPDYEQGWKDVVWVPMNQSVTFMTRFTDFADSVHPFMYHCHFGAHEDGGMMGQFVVVDNSTGLANVAKEHNELDVYPNPTTEQLHLNVNDVQHVFVVNAIGQSNELTVSNNLVDVSSIADGMYLLKAVDRNGKNYSAKFTKQ